MELTSLIYIAFVSLFCLIYYVIPKSSQWVVLLVASLMFFVLSSGFLTGYMILATLVAYLGALFINHRSISFSSQIKNIDKSKRKETKNKFKKSQKAIVATVIIVILGILAFLKYSNFGIEIINLISSVLKFGFIIPKVNIILPLGISYYTLMVISYVVDVHRGVIQAEKNPLRLLLYVTYFPHIIEGPFDRYKDLSAQFKQKHNFNYDNFRKGLILILYGFFKKMLVADRIGLVVTDIFANINEHSGTAVIMGTVLYTVQLYCDFSGCIDIISGVSELFDIKVAENFRQPFFSKSISEFWRRWHISLGLWLKEYVYYPVVLSKHFKRVDKFTKKHLRSKHLLGLIPAAYALFFVWFTNGIWHGASFKYIIYGLYYYLLMMMGEFIKPFTDKLIEKIKINPNGGVFNAFQIVRTFIIVNIGMLLFRSDGIGEFASLLIKTCTSFNLSDFSLLPSVEILTIILIGILIVFIVDFVKEKGIDIRNILIQKSFVLRWAVCWFLIFSVLIFGVYGVEFGEVAAIYAQF